jgi:hypothetical protein
MSNVSLKSIALKSFLDNKLTDLLQDEDSKATMMSFFSEHFASQWLQSASSLYHIYCVNAGRSGRHYSKLLKSFVSEMDAGKWATEYGGAVIEDIQQDRQVTMMLIIVFNNEDTKYSSDAGLRVPEKLNPTFLFSQKAYDIMLADHYLHSEEYDYDFPNPFWLNFVENKVIVSRGCCTKEHIMRVYREWYNVGENVMQAQLLEFDRAQMNIDEWVADKRSKHDDSVFCYY